MLPTHLSTYLWITQSKNHFYITTHVHWPLGLKLILHNYSKLVLEESSSTIIIKNRTHTWKAENIRTVNRSVTVAYSTSYQSWKPVIFVFTVLHKYASKAADVLYLFSMRQDVYWTESKRKAVGCISWDTHEKGNHNHNTHTNKYAFTTQVYNITFFCFILTIMVC